MAQREPGRRLLKVAVGGPDLTAGRDGSPVPCRRASLSSYWLTALSVTWPRKSHGEWPDCSCFWHSRPDRS
jgi:hypothetical protein